MTNEEYIAKISEVPNITKEVLNKEGKIEYRYIPKSVLQTELLNIYGGHTKWEMLRETVTSKGMFGTGLFHYKHPVSGEWLYVAGTASLPHEKKMRLSFPGLESHCFLNAVKKIGIRFGQILNMQEEDDMPEEEKQFEELSPEEQAVNLSQQLVDAGTIQELKSYRLLVYAKTSPKDLQDLYETRLRQLNKTK